MNLFQELRRWRDDRKNINILSAMSTRELDDLGITRSDIKRVVRKK